jgi:hypothetical protein
VSAAKKSAMPEEVRASQEEFRAPLVGGRHERKIDGTIVDLDTGKVVMLADGTHVEPDDSAPSAKEV